MEPAASDDPPASPEPLWRRLALDLACVTALGALVVAQLWPGLSNGLSPPISWDHGAHLGKAMITAEDLLPALRGWTDRIELGVPLNTIYSAMGTLWVLLARAATPWLEWHQSYAIAMVAARTFGGAAVYRLARVAGASRLGATFAGFLAVIDVGDHSEGGWFYEVHYGVWPMSLAVSIWLLGVAELLAYARGAGRPRIALAVLLLGLALAAHQFALPATCVAMVALAAAAKLDGNARLRVVTLIGVAVGAFLVAAWWLVPVLAWERWMDDHGQLFQTLREVGSAMADGKPFRARMAAPASEGVWSGVLVSLGTLLCLVRRSPARALAAAAACFVGLTVVDWVRSTDLLHLMPSFGRLMFPRFWMLAKPLAFVCAGVAATWTVRVLVRRASRRAKLAAALSLLLVVPFVWGARRRLIELWIAREPQVYTANLEGWGDYLAFGRWMREDGDPRPYRVAYYDTGSHLYQSAAAYTGRPAHQIGPLVAEGFRNSTTAGDLTTLRTLDVRYVVTWGAATPPGIAHVLQQVQSFGPVRVHELRGWRARGVVADPDVIEPTLIAWERDSLVVAPNGARDLTVRRAMAPGWRAYADGTEIAVEPRVVRGSPRLLLMGLTVPPGTARVELRYDAWTWPILLGFALSAAGLVAVGLAWRRGPWDRPVRALHAFLDDGPRWVPALAVVVLGVVVASWVAMRAYAHVPLHRQLARVELTLRKADGTLERCRVPFKDDKARGVRCRSREHVGLAARIVRSDGRLRSCIATHPPEPGEVLRIAFPDPPAGTLRMGAGHDEDADLSPRVAPTAVTVLQGNRRLGVLSVPATRWVEERYPITDTAPLVVEVLAPTTARRWLCLDPVVER